MDIHQEDKVVLNLIHTDENSEKAESVELTASPSRLLPTYITEANKLTIQIFGSRYIAKIEHFKTGAIIELTNANGEKVLSLGSDDFEKSYSPGKYCILVQDTYFDENHEYSFIVKPVYVSDSFRNNMIRYIDSYLHNVQLHRNNLRKNEESSVEKAVNYDKWHLKINITKLCNNLNNTIVTDYVSSHIMKVQDARTVRMMAQKVQGKVSKNYVNARKKESLDVPINRSLKYILITLLSDKSIEQECRQLLKKLEEVSPDANNLGGLSRLPYYREIYNWYLSYQSCDSEGLIESSYLHTNLDTPNIFELYVLVKLLKHYEQSGFQFNQGSSEISAQLIYKDYSLIVLRKENESISIDFNYNIIKNPEKLDTDCMISINRTLSNSKKGKRGPYKVHGRPDFVIKKYRENKIVSIQIIETKCRNIKNIVDNEQLVDEVEQQCRAYLTLGYIDKNQELHIGLVKRVLLIHPSISGDEQRRSFFFNRIITHSITQNSSIGELLE